MAEMKRFIFLVTFLLIFGSTTVLMPSGFYGEGADIDGLPNIDPTTISDFTDYTNFSHAAYTGIPLTYAYSFNSENWVSWQFSSAFVLSRKVYFWGFWFGEYEAVTFVAQSGADRGTSLSFTEIDTDDNNGSARYDLKLMDSGKSAGTWVLGWDPSAYATPALAWVADDLQVAHGVGLDDTAAPEASFNMLIALVTFSIPNIPLLLGIFFASPIYAAGVYLIWFIVKESMPFVW